MSFARTTPLPITLVKNVYAANALARCVKTGAIEASDRLEIGPVVVKRL